MKTPDYLHDTIEIVPLSTPFVTCFAVLSYDSIILIDGGFLGHLRKIENLLEHRNLDFNAIKLILLTHGHLDHTLNLARIASLSQCAICAPTADAAHVAGTFPYKSGNLSCNLLERAGRTLLRYKTPDSIEYGDDDQTWPRCGGIRRIPLPGHTVGHCGYYFEREHALFVGDLISSYGRPRLPYRGLNSAPERFPESLERVLALETRAIYPNHHWKLSPERLSDTKSDWCRRFIGKFAKPPRHVAT